MKFAILSLLGLASAVALKVKDHDIVVFPCGDTFCPYGYRCEATGFGHTDYFCIP